MLCNTFSTLCRPFLRITGSSWLLRPLLLLSALGATRAQLVGYAAWPMRGRNGVHAANGLIIAPNNSVAVVKFQVGGEVKSSSVVGVDGTVYIGSEGYLYALKADGSLKWKYQNGTSIYSSPAVGADGTVYFGSDDSYLYALHADGRLKWKYQTGGKIDNSSPTLGADGTVYIGSTDGSLYALKPGGSLKWKYQTGGERMFPCESSPAVGADGTVYIGSGDGSLDALDPNGSLKWKYVTAGYGQPVYSSPAVGADGTVYAGSDHHLYALEPDGSLKWTYETGGETSESSPVVGADGTVYFGSSDNYLYAFNADGSLKWNHKYKTGGYTVVSSPALGADGTVYIGSDDHYLYALNADGSLKWKYQTGNTIKSSPAVSADGTVYIGSDDGHLHVLGLSAGHVTSSLHLAQRALARNESALPKLERLCNFSSVIHFVPSCNATVGCNVCGACCKDYIPAGQCASCFAESCPKRNDTFTPETVELVNTSCQMLRNYNASAPYLKAWEGFVDPLSFTDYKGLISTGGTMMTLLQSYEAKLADFKKAEATVDARIAAAQDAVKGYAADAANWQGHSQRDTTTMSAYGKEITTLGQQMDAKFVTLQGSVHGLIDSLNAKLADLKKKFEAAKRADEAKHWWSFLGAIVHVVKAIVSVAGCYTASTATAGAALLACGKENKDAIGSAIGSVKGCYESFRSSCKPCKELQAEMQEARATEQEIDALAAMTKAAEALNDQLSKDAPLPQARVTHFFTRPSLPVVCCHSKPTRPSAHQQPPPPGRSLCKLKCAHLSTRISTPFTGIAAPHLGQDLDGRAAHLGRRLQAGARQGGRVPGPAVYQRHRRLDRHGRHARLTLPLVLQPRDARAERRRRAQGAAVAHVERAGPPQGRAEEGGGDRHRGAPRARAPAEAGARSPGESVLAVKLRRVARAPTCAR